MEIAGVGTGDVGLVSGVCFSDFGHKLVCVDKDPAKNVEAVIKATKEAKRTGFKSFISIGRMPLETPNIGET